jgi:protein import protein ZIM17
MAMRPSSSLLRLVARASAPHTFKASPAQHIPAPAKRLLHTPRTSPLARPSPILSRARAAATCRCESTSAAPKQANTSTTAPESRLDREQIPSYELTFTCNVCKTRSSHRLSKQGYHKGTVLISCPDCKNRHLISDHLKVGHILQITKVRLINSSRSSQTSPSQSKTSCGKKATWLRKAP